MTIQGNFQEALQFIDSSCQQLECEGSCYYWLFFASLMLEDFEQAERYYDQMQDTSYDIGYVYYQLGKTEEAEKIFSEEIQKLQSNLDEENGLNYLELASIYAFQGDRDKALANLAEYAKQGFTFGYQDFILIDPFFESLRDDPEFKSIVKQAQQEKAALRNQVREMEERGELTL